MSNTHGALVVVGSGPGIGVATAQYFASKSFKHIILLSRNEERLAQDAATVTASGAQVKTLKIDLSADEDKTREVLDQADSLLHDWGTRLEVVLYNGARVGPSKILEWKGSGLEEDLKITTVSMYYVLQWAIPRLLATGKETALNPAFLVTSGLLYRDPFSNLFSLSAGKAAQHNLVQSFHKKFDFTRANPKSVQNAAGGTVHIAAVPVGGLVSDDAAVTTAKAVAEKFWELYTAEKGVEGKVSVEMLDPGYSQGVEALVMAVEAS